MRSTSRKFSWQCLQACKYTHHTYTTALSTSATQGISAGILPCKCCRYACTYIAHTIHSFSHIKETYLQSKETKKQKSRQHTAHQQERCSARAADVHVHASLIQNCPFTHKRAMFTHKRAMFMHKRSRHKEISLTCGIIARALLCSGCRCACMYVHHTHKAFLFTHKRDLCKHKRDLFAHKRYLNEEMKRAADVL